MKKKGYEKMEVRFDFYEAEHVILLSNAPQPGDVGRDDDDDYVYSPWN